MWSFTLISVLHLAIMLVALNLLLVIGPSVCERRRRQTSSRNKTRQYRMARQEVLELLIRKSSYNHRITPDYENDFPTRVQVQIHVNSIYDINEQSMDFTMNIYLRQRWRDPRLDFSRFSQARMLELDTKYMARVWVPDTFFRNEKKGEFHKVTVPNRLMQLYQNGTIYYSIRLSVLLSCHMKLHKYPMDIQRCPIKIGSYGYTTENIEYHWVEHNPIDFEEDLHLSKYALVGHTLHNCTRTLTETGRFSCVEVDLILKRHMGYFLVQVYIPGTLVIILSWVSFWLDVESVPARISLGVLTVLTTSTQMNGIRASLPRVNYVKAIDVWMSATLIFVFAALLEFAYITVLYRRRTPYNWLARRASHQKDLEEAANGSSNHEKSKEKRHGRSPRHRFYGKQGAKSVDKLARALFPLAFTIFNIGYWLAYYLMEV